MKYCKICSKEFDEESLSACPDDGTPLIEIDNEDSNLEGIELDGRIVLQEQIGRGGMGAVYRAFQKSMDRTVAVKVLLREFSANVTAIKSFFKEVNAASKLTHPNTITIYDFGKAENNLLYMVMEYLDGGPLSQVLKREGPLSVERALKILVQVCHSLSEAHANGIIHRDLKPDNIFVVPKPGNPDFVKVIDFGVARILGRAGQLFKTETGTLTGTPAYMSPEQLLGRSVDGRADIYAVGMIMYEMLTLKLPYGSEAESVTEAALEAVSKAPITIGQWRPDHDLTQDEKNLMLCCLEKDPEARFESVNALAEAIQYCLDVRRSVNIDRSSPIPRFTGSTLPGTTSHEKKRRGWLLRGSTLFGIAGVLAVAIAFGAIFMLSNRDGAPVSVAQGTPAPTLERRQRHLEGLGVSRMPSEAADTVPAEVTISLESVPERAEVLSGRERLGRTPLDVTRPRSDQQLNLVFRARGYVPWRTVVLLDQNRVIRARLKRVPKTLESTDKPSLLKLE